MTTLTITVDGDHIGDRVTNHRGTPGVIVAADDLMVKVKFQAEHMDYVGWFNRTNDDRLTLTEES